jgi:Zn-dependent protease with chaperone function
MEKNESLLRVEGEYSRLFISIFLYLFSALLILQINPLLFVFLILIQLLWIIFNQKQIHGNSILISENQFSEINKIIDQSCQYLGIEKPNSYVMFDPYLNAFVMGFKKPYTLVLTSALIESLTENELRFVIGHELGHLKMGHSRIKSFVVPNNKDIPFITFIFNFWLRKTEYTADRVGLLVNRKNLKDSINALMKITVGKEMAEKINIKKLIEQSNPSKSKSLEKISEWFLTHPYVINRIKQLINFYNNYIYE